MNKGSDIRPGVASLPCAEKTIMATVAPPPAPPRVNTGDDGRTRKLRLRMGQVLSTMVTLLITAWICSFGAIPAIVALVTAKHVLVAILLVGMGVDAEREEGWAQSP
jgi:hypothetical protein